MPVLVTGATFFGVGLAVAALMPSYALFAVALVLIGVSAQTFTTTSNSVLQLSSEPAMRGRVVAIFLAVALGGTPIGAPIVGWVVDAFGPRWGLGVGAAGGFVAALIGLSDRARPDPGRDVRSGRGSRLRSTPTRCTGRRGGNAAIMKLAK
jgi:MFS family permease